MPPHALDKALFAGRLCGFFGGSRRARTFTATCRRGFLLPSTTLLCAFLLPLALAHLRRLFFERPNLAQDREPRSEIFAMSRIAGSGVTPAEPEGYRTSRAPPEPSPGPKGVGTTDTLCTLSSVRGRGSGRGSARVRAYISMRI